MKTQTLFHNLISSSIRTITVGNGISPYQSLNLRESRTITAGRELHPALKKFKITNSIFRLQNYSLKYNKQIIYIKK